MPDFDLDDALSEPAKQNPVPTCPKCNERMAMDSCDTGENGVGFSLKRVCNFACNSPACDVPENDDRGVWMTEELVVVRVTCDLEPMGRSAIHSVSMGRCPWCRSISGPSHNHIYQPASGGLYLGWECEDCGEHWEEHLEVPNA